MDGSRPPSPEPGTCGAALLWTTAGEASSNRYSHPQTGRLLGPGGTLARELTRRGWWRYQRAYDNIRPAALARVGIVGPLQACLPPACAGRLALGLQGQEDVSERAMPQGLRLPPRVHRGDGAGQGRHRCQPGGGAGQPAEAARRLSRLLREKVRAGRAALRGLRILRGEGQDLQGVLRVLQGRGAGAAPAPASTSAPTPAPVSTPTPTPTQAPALAPLCRELTGAPRTWPAPETVCIERPRRPRGSLGSPRPRCKENPALLRFRPPNDRTFPARSQ